LGGSTGESFLVGSLRSLYISAPGLDQYSINMTQLSWDYKNHEVVTSKAFYNITGVVSQRRGPEELPAAAGRE